MLELAWEIVTALPVSSLSPSDSRVDQMDERFQEDRIEMEFEQRMRFCLEH